MHRALALALVIGAAACKSTSRNDMIDSSPPPKGAVERPSLAVPTGGGPMSVAGALNLLATARCEREQQCGRIGQGKTYRNVESCERTALQAHANDVTLLQCKGPLDSKRLETCATKLKTLPCGHEELAASELCGEASGPWRMTGIDPEGCDMVCDGATARVAFAVRIKSPGEARAELVRLAGQARESGEKP